MIASGQIDGGVEAWLAAHERKELVRLVVVGSVDDGKSTLIGRILFETNSLYEDHIAQVRRASKGGVIDYSLFTDGLRAEREQGITIDVAYRYFATQLRKFIVADTPGHVQYTRNMATGASTADLAVILVDARLGVLAQTRRHAHIASLLGIERLVVAVNKMDLVGFDPAVFGAIRSELERFTQPLGFEEVVYFPISAVGGDNIVTRSDRTPFHDGPPLLEYLETAPIGGRDAAEPFRFPVQLALRPTLDYRGFAGRIASGRVSTGDEIVVLPSGRRTRIAGIDTFEGTIATAHAPMSVTLRLADEVDVSRGDLITHPQHPAAIRHSFEATVVWLHERPLDPARALVLKHSSRTVTARVDRVHWKTDPDRLENVVDSTLGMNDLARVTITCHRGLCLDAYADNRHTGRFILIDALTNATVAGGIIHAPVDDGSESGRRRGPVTAAEREDRLGQRGVVVSVPADAAYALERSLFDAGLHVVVAHSEAAAASLASAAIIAISPAASAGEHEGLRAVVEAIGLKLIVSAPGESVDSVGARVREAARLPIGEAVSP